MSDPKKPETSNDFVLTANRDEKQPKSTRTAVSSCTKT